VKGARALISWNLVGIIVASGNINVRIGCCRSGYFSVASSGYSGEEIN